MAKERLKSPRARLFVALDLPERVRDGLARWQRRECTDPALRPVPAHALHVTLCFLGYQPEKEIDRIAEVVAGPAPRPVPMRFDPDPVPLPKGRPRLFAIGADAEAAVELQGEVSDALEAERLYRPEKRDFWPHVTVARVRPERSHGGPPRSRRGRPQRVERPPGALPRSLLDPFSGVRVALYRSILKPQGAEYVSLAGVDLPSATGV
ncbi:MAG TPA: RNA 2',3'-cyclic phosphodiesterase [Solirubrobacterales bacterium]|nr:RNA 2',3'-cyclic phosphodiesterase [Solirubrobacterales bacterium]